MPNGRSRISRLVPAVFLVVSAVPVALADRPGQPRLQVAAKSLLAIEQMDADFVATRNTIVQRQPKADSEKLLNVTAGEKIWVTGRVRELNWFRVTVDGRYIGYIDGAHIRRAPQEAAAPPPEEDKVAVVVAPPKPAIKAPVEPAVGQFASPELFQHCDHCPEMVALPAGSFTMGVEGGDGSEGPPHEVTIGYRFGLGRFEVTVAQWLACVDAGACSYQPEAGSNPGLLPVRNVSWDDAQEYLAWLGKTTGKPYRLPSEAEWEYAARGGTQAHYWWGDSLGVGRANCRDCGEPWEKRKPAKIGSYPANPFGLHDLNGGVAEWTGDCWYKSHAGMPTDGSSREKRDCQKRVLRGGSWRDEGSYLRSTSRLYYDASVPYIVNGFRVALTLD